MSPASIRPVALLSALAVAALVACATSSSSGTPTTDPLPTSPDDAGSDAPAKPVETPDAKAPEKDAAPEAPECASTASQADCITCCQTAHSDGADVYFNALFDCMCAADACQKECGATFCDGQNPDATCNKCISDHTSTCGKVIQQTCGNDPQCVLFAQCADKADCRGKN